MQINTKLAHDWCHVCGKRKEVDFAEVWYPVNAEHGGSDDRYLRICGYCVIEIHTAIFPGVTET